MGLFDKKPGRVLPNATSSKPRYGLLLVDDEMFNLTTLAGLLEDQYRVFTATSGQEALKLLEDPATAAQVQVIISDQRMPGMSGVELLGRVQALAPGLKRVLLTGYTDVDAIINAINDAAVYKYIRKPVDSHELELTLARALESWQLEQDHARLLSELRQALDRLALLDADKLEFLRYLAHEMNTPLNWLGATQILDREAQSAEVQEILGYVDQGQERLRALVRAVLRYFQVAAMKEESRRSAQIDLPLLLQERVKLQRERSPGIDIRLTQPLTLTLESDAALLTEALDHLLENALAHAAHGPEPKVDITLRHSGQQIELEVHNSGRGLEAAALSSLFRPFRFGSDHGSAGFGISLATVQALCRALGGTVEAQSEGGEQGVAICLRLPPQLGPVGAA